MFYATYVHIYYTMILSDKFYEFDSSRQRPLALLLLLFITNMF